MCKKIIGEVIVIVLLVAIFFVKYVRTYIKMGNLKEVGSIPTTKNIKKDVKIDVNMDL